MRSSAAAFDRLEVPDTKKKPRKPQATSRGKRKKKGRGQTLNACAKYAAVSAGVIIACGIMVNALMFQKGRHPAPLFGKAVDIHLAGNTPQPRGHVESAPAAAPVASAEPQASSEARALPAHRDASPAAPPAAATITGDPIGQLLRRSGVGADGGDKRVHAVQEALIKLGYSVKANGNLNAPTRKALAAFAKQHHLPAKGEMDSQTLKALAAASHHHLI